MASYKYFTKLLLKSQVLNLSSVFPASQKVAQEQNNVSYDLVGICDYIRTATEDFKFVDQKYIDLDNAVAAIIDKYYTSINEKNPFKEADESIISDDTYVTGNVPREAAIVEDGKVTGKGVARAPRASAKTAEVVVEEITPEVVEAAEVEPTQEDIINAIETLKLLADDGDEESIEAIKTLKLLLNEEETDNF